MKLRLNCHIRWASLSRGSTGPVAAGRRSFAQFIGFPRLAVCFISSRALMSFIFIQFGRQPRPSSGTLAIASASACTEKICQMYEHTVIISKAFKFQLKFQNIFIYDWKPYQKISHVFIITYIFFLCMGAPWKSPVSEWARPQGNTMKGSSGPLFLQQEGTAPFTTKGSQPGRQPSISSSSNCFSLAFPPTFPVPQFINLFSIFMRSVARSKLFRERPYWFH